MAKQKWYRFYLYLALEIARKLASLLPRGFARRAGEGCGHAVYWLLPEHRRNVESRIAERLRPRGDWNKPASIARRMYARLGQGAVDVCRFPALTRQQVEKLVKADGVREKMNQVLKRGKGFILLSGHIGNWEFLGPFLSYSGYPTSAIGRRIYYGPYNRLLVDLRRSVKVRTIYRDDSPRVMLEALKRNEVIGMFADQDIDSVNGVFIPFLGRPAWTPTGPARLALASGAPLVPAFMLHEGGGYRLCIEEPIWPSKEEPKEIAVTRMMSEWSAHMERYVRTYPDQWAWFHDRWKTSPAPNGSSVPKAVASSTERTALEKLGLTV